jgi:poly-gamma-glutamate capsule biosynthesis protein CapA/YwtB (metallophosphatase superfamily)
MKRIFVICILMALLSNGCAGDRPIDDRSGDTKAEPEEAVEQQAVNLRIVAVGDIMLSRTVGAKIRNNSVYYPFELTSDITSSADLTFGNLETTLATTGERLPGKGIWFRAVPEAAKGLKYAGFDVLSLANNHILDYDTPALLETMDVLEKQHIGYVGAGKDLKQARCPIIVIKDGIRVGFLAYNEFYNYFWDYSYRRTFEATDETAGTAPLKEDIIEEDIKNLKKICDIVVVSPHWGVEESNRVVNAQQQLAHRMIDWGADMVLGHHPHVLQGIEIYNGKPIVYSLANFVFDQNDENNKESMILEIFTENSTIKEIHAYPVYIAEKGRPGLAEGAKREHILEKILKLSRDLGSQGIKEPDRVVFKLE